ncbi:MAG: DEAD/DEAH box helicase family protein, partial [Fusobacterium sp.]
GVDEMSKNLEDIQKNNGLVFDEEVKKNCIIPKDFTIEMETGTGKTYVYIKTALELSKKYGLKKFIIVVPSVAIREGVKKTLEITKEHFSKEYDPYNYFVYDSNKFSDIKGFGESKNIQIMVINIDAFNSKKNRRIYEEQESTDGNRPIDIIKQAKPIVIIDEPQSVLGKLGKDAIKELNPLMIFRYSATHKERTFDLYKLDAIDSYRQGLVKEIIVNSIEVDEDFNEPYMYFISAKEGQAKLILNIKSKNKYIRSTRTVKQNDRLIDITNNTKYEGYFIKNIGFEKGKEFIEISHINKKLTKENREFGGVESDIIKRFQIRQTIKEHLLKEIEYRKTDENRGRIKVLSLFFIDRVSNYVTYENSKRKKNGKFAKMFEEEYKKVFDELYNEKYRKLTSENFEILNKLKHQEISKIHDGYFSMDKKASFKDNYSLNKNGDYNLTTKDESTFDLIMKDKEKLLSLDNPLRFIFSHSALKEGWDNPNVFQICTLNETKSEMKKRQEIGRGLRLAVDEFGRRIEEGGKRNINRLTVMVNESYEEFTDGLQKEYEKDGVVFGVIQGDSFSNLPSSNKEEFKIGNEKSREIFDYLKKEGYLNKENKPSNKYKEDLLNGVFKLPKELDNERKEVIKILDKLTTKIVKDGHEKERISINEKAITNPEFKKLWNKIKHKTKYKFKIDSKKLIDKGIKAIKNIDIDELILLSKQSKIVIDDDGMSNDKARATGKEKINKPYFPNILLELQNTTNFSRNDIAKILSKSDVISELRKNPEKFLLEVSKRLNIAMNEYLMEEECIKYIKLGDDKCYVQENIFQETLEIFNDYIVESIGNKSIYSKFEYDSIIEQEFAKNLEKDENVVLYTKLPKEFKIDTPIGNYNPDWAIVYKTLSEEIKIYFIIETKGTLDKFKRRGSENYKIECAKKHFFALNEGVEENDKIHYEVARNHNDFEKIAIRKS